MAAIKTQYEVVDEEFREKLRDAAEKVGDIRPALLSIKASWFKSNRAIFNLKGPGQFQDLSERYKKQKRGSLGFVYPILEAENKRIKGSLTKPGHKDSIAQIVGKSGLVLGTSTPYAIYLHAGTKHMPPRPVVFIGAEQTGAPPPIENKRREIWFQIIEQHVAEALK